MSIALTLRHRGAGGTLARAGTILSRFGVTAGPMARRLTHYTDLVTEFNARPSFPITACVLNRHAALIRSFAERGVEFAIHGLVHNDHAKLSLDQQQTTIAQAAALFQSAGVQYSGFRGPFLRFNQATDDVVRSLGLRYHSSQPVLFSVLSEALEHGPHAAAYHGVLDHLYSPQDAAKVVVRPRHRHGLIDIPVALPDDEIMVERLQIDEQAQAAIWLAMLETTYTRGDLFTVQLHPERSFECGYALRAILEQARAQQPAIWIARLDEIADWWLRRHATTLRVEPLADDRYRVVLDGAQDATLLVRSLPNVDASPWYGHERIARSHRFEIEAPVKPIVGVSHRSPHAVLDFLTEEGLPTEVSDDRERFGAYLDIANDSFDEVAVLDEIEHARGPLVRLWRWPAATRSAMAITGDIDCITLQDFALRLWETRQQS